jgi:hypothetical protein
MTSPLDFIVIGAPRSGTTAIASYLGDHPDIVVSSPKETHFFDAHYADGVDSISAYFAHRGTERIAGEATPAYLVSPWVPERIATTVPDVKLIATLREPASRAFSHWWLLYSRGIEDLSFEDAIAANLDRIEQGPPITEAGWQEHVAMRTRGVAQKYRMYVDHGFYAAGIRRYYEFFDPTALHVVFTHQLAADTPGVVSDLVRFVGADNQIVLADPERVNEALGSSGRTVMQAARRTGLSRLGPLLPDSLKQKVKQRLAKMGDKEQLSEEMRAHLRTLYRPSVEELEALLSVDLSVWKSD